MWWGDGRVWMMGGHLRAWMGNKSAVGGLDVCWVMLVRVAPTCAHRCVQLLCQRCAAPHRPSQPACPSLPTTIAPSLLCRPL